MSAVSREELMKIHEDVCGKARALMAKKNLDYGAVTDPFANFRRIEAMGICKTEAGIMVRMLDKMSRASSYLERGELSVKDETVVDSLTDLVNYSILLIALLEDNERRKAA